MFQKAIDFFLKNLKPDISILIFTYNQSSMIAQSIESALMQQIDQKIEIIIGDDCSDDGTREIAADYARRFPGKIRLIQNNRPPGSFEFYFKLLDAVRGEFVALLEGDDYWTDPYKLSKQYAFLKDKKDYIACVHNNIIRNEWVDVEILRYKNAADHTVNFNTLLEGNPFHTSSLMYRRNVLPKYPKCFLNFEFGDWTMLILLAQVGKIYFLSDIMSTYRIHSGGAWSGKYRIPSEKRIPEVSAAGKRVPIEFWRVLKEYLGPKYHEKLDSLISDRLFELGEMK